MTPPPSLPVLQRRDQLDRPLRDLRISVTDRCNFRCRYCMPREAFGPGFRFMERPLLLSFEEISRLAASFVRLGVEKLRLTGGEPLLRRQLHVLVEQLGSLSCDLSLTTNGSLLAAQAADLRKAGLKRLTISVDSLDPGTFERITDSGHGLSSVLRGLEAAEIAGFESIKINTVVRRGLNDGELVRLARYFADRGHIVRFIEFMDVGETNGWQRREVVGADEIVERLGRELDLRPLAPNYTGEVARRYQIADTSAEIGVITSVTRPFCRDCTRARLSADGNLFTCLFAGAGTDLKGPLRAGASDADIEALIGRVWQQRSDRYSEQRAERGNRRRIEMSYIGG